ncbi:MAG TPA: ATP-binding protein [Chroococcidiopsis sp.]
MGLPWSQWSARHRGAVLIAIPALSLVVTLGAWVWTRQGAIAVQSEITKSQTIILNTDRVLIALLSAESTARDYVMTSNSAFLSSHRQYRDELRNAFKQLKLSLYSNAAPEPQFAKLEQQLTDQRRLMAALITEKITSPLPIETSTLSRLLEQDQRQLEAIHLQLEDLIDESNTKLGRDRNRLVELREITNSVIWIMALTSVFGYLAALYLFSRLDWELQGRQLELHESKSILDAVVGNVVDGVITLNDHSTIETFNKSAEQMFGYTAPELLGQELTLLLQEWRTDWLRDSLLEEDLGVALPLAQRLGQHWLTTARRRDGSVFPVEVSISDMQLDHRFIAIIRDVTERQQVEAMLKKRAEELTHLSLMMVKTNATLEERNRELDQFAYVASHDLKAPLRAIANLSEWLEEDLMDRLPDTSKYQMQLLRGRVHRLEALINGLLEYSRVGRIQTPTELVNVEMLLVEVIDSLNPPPSCTIKIAPDMPTLHTQRLPLRQVFANLISNAIQHGNRPDIHIWIRVSDRPSDYEFTVTDNGQGIAPDYHHKIFVIFQTLEARDTKESTGIGLAIVKKIVEGAGGTITLDSQLNQGATFRFTWPKYPSEDSSAGG